MSDRSKIEWTDATWNPLRAKNPDTGKLGHHCVKISPACTHCYAASMNKRLGTSLDYSSNSPAQTFIDKVALMKPFHWKRPRRIFPCSMTDLFLDSYSDSELDCVFSVMAANPRHTFQVLTKRPERLFTYIKALENAAWDHAPRTKCGEFSPTQVLNLRMFAGSKVPGGILGRAFDAPWPLPNVQLGVTAENQEFAQERIPWLIKTPAAARFLSCEPLLGAIKFCECWMSDNTLPNGACRNCGLFPLGGGFFRWVIVGGESGQQARPMHPDWARGLRDQCKAAEVPFFFKQWGEWHSGAGLPPSMRQESRHGFVCPYGCHANRVTTETLQEHSKTCTGSRLKAAGVPMAMYRVGKSNAGRLLDGREWNEFPAAADVAVTS